MQKNDCETRSRQLLKQSPADLMMISVCDHPLLRKRFWRAGWERVRTPSRAFPTENPAGRMQREVSVRRLLRKRRWRMGWDSNPRSPCRLAGFQDQCIQPLCHPSVTALNQPGRGSASTPFNAGTAINWQSYACDELCFV